MSRQSLGKLGEEIAVNFLKKKGYKILERNFKSSRFGEIDIIAKDYSNWPKIFGFRLPFFVRIIRMPFIDWHHLKSKATLVFVEVKTKSNDQFGLPEEELTFYKKQHLQRAIQDYFWAKEIEADNYRIDLIAVDFTENKEKPEIRHYQGIY